MQQSVFFSKRLFLGYAAGVGLSGGVGSGTATGPTLTSVGSTAVVVDPGVIVFCQTLVAFVGPQFAVVGFVVG